MRYGDHRDGDHILIGYFDGRTIKYSARIHFILSHMPPTALFVWLSLIFDEIISSTGSMLVQRLRRWPNIEPALVNI